MKQQDKSVFFKICAKIYELFLRTFRPIPIDYFCQVFPARPYPSAITVSNECQIDIFIPFRDKWELTRQCLDSLLQQNAPQIRITLHLLDNGSNTNTQASLKNWIDQNHGHLTFVQHRIEEPFNFSKLCNRALNLSPEAKRYFLFLNNDVLLADSETLFTSANFLQQNSDCSALGITLLFENRTIQHLFAAPGVKIIAAHPYKGKSPAILNKWNSLARRVPAITGAYFMIPSLHFHEVGGFDENLPTAGQDIDLCLKLMGKGLGSWVLPKIQAFHFESASRRRSPINRAEVDYFYKKWQGKLSNQPAYPVDISRWSEQPARRMLETRYPYELII
jgi:GT2 family glycosyltransferase